MDQETYDKIEWIDINLPWDVKISWDDGPIVPDLKEREREVFGLSLEDSEIANKDHFEAYGRLQDELRNLQYHHGNDDWSVNGHREQIASSFWKKHEKDVCVIARDAHFVLVEKIRDWSCEQPEVKAHAKAIEEYMLEEKGKSFSGRGLAKPGTIIEMEDGSIEFIGTMNMIAGVCDDCIAFENEGLIVKRYAQVYPFVRRKAQEDL